MSVPPAEPADSAVRCRLLQAALTLFTERGYAATTVREIVETAGVTKPVLYYYFGSKEGLYLALIEESFANFDQMLNEVAAAPGSARERLLSYCDTIFASAAANVQLVRLTHAIYYGPPQGAPFFDFDVFFQKMLDGITALLAAGIAAGEFRPLPLHELTWLVMGALHLSMQEQICQASPRIDAAGLRTALTILLDSITPGDRS